MKNKNFTFEIIRRGRGKDTYRVNNIEGMTEQEILDACDAYNFGGQVYGKIAEVYTD